MVELDLVPKQNIQNAARVSVKQLLLRHPDLFPGSAKQSAEEGMESPELGIVIKRYAEWPFGSKPTSNEGRFESSYLVEPAPSEAFEKIKAKLLQSWGSYYFASAGTNGPQLAVVAFQAVAREEGEFIKYYSERADKFFTASDRNWGMPYIVSTHIGVERSEDFCMIAAICGAWVVSPEVQYVISLACGVAMGFIATLGDAAEIANNYLDPKYHEVFEEIVTNLLAA